MKKALASLLAVAPLVAGCGGDGDANTTPSAYSADATRACLEDAGARIDDDHVDAVAGRASGGAYIAILEDEKIVNLGFGADEEEGKALIDGYEAVGGDKKNVYRKRNVALSWAVDPGGARSTVDNCLK